MSEEEHRPRAKLEYNLHFFASNVLHSVYVVSSATSVMLSKSKWYPSGSFRITTHIPFPTKGSFIGIPRSLNSWYKASASSHWKHMDGPDFGVLSCSGGCPLSSHGPWSINATASRSSQHHSIFPLGVRCLVIVKPRSSV